MAYILLFASWHQPSSSKLHLTCSDQGILSSFLLMIRGQLKSSMDSDFPIAQRRTITLSFQAMYTSQRAFCLPTLLHIIGVSEVSPLWGAGELCDVSKLMLLQEYNITDIRATFHQQGKTNLSHGSLTRIASPLPCKRLKEFRNQFGRLITCLQATMHRTGKGKWTAAMCNIKLATIDTNTVLVSYRNCNHSSKRIDRESDLPNV